MPKVAIEILPTQAAFIQCEDRCAGLVGGFAAGKTKIASDWFIDRTRKWPDAVHCVAGKDLKQLKRGTLESLMDGYKSRGIPLQYNSSEAVIKLYDTGTIIQPLSAENYKAWRSLEADTIWADELSEWTTGGADLLEDAKLFTKYLYPRCRYSPRGKKYIPLGMKPQMRFTTNPPENTIHWLYDLLVTKKFCQYWHMSLRDNYLMDGHAEYLESQLKAISPDLYPILIDGQFGNVTQGAVYKGFSKPKHVSPPAMLPADLGACVFDPTQPICWSLDFNVGLMCSIISQPVMQKIIFDRFKSIDIMRPVQVLSDYKRKMYDNYQERVFKILDIIRLPDSGTPDVLNEFLVRWGEQARRVGVRIYGDASGGSRAQQISAQSAARSNWDIILHGLAHAGIRTTFMVPTTNPSVGDRVNAVKAQMVTGDGVGLIINGENCNWLIIDLEAVKYKPGTNDIDKMDNPLLTHLTDALGYMCWVEREIFFNRRIEFQGTNV